MRLQIWGARFGAALLMSGWLAGAASAQSIPCDQALELCQAMIPSQCVQRLGAGFAPAGDDGF